MLSSQIEKEINRLKSVLTICELKFSTTERTLLLESIEDLKQVILAEASSPSVSKNTIQSPEIQTHTEKKSVKQSIWEDLSPKSPPNPPVTSSPVSQQSTPTPEVQNEPTPVQVEPIKQIHTVPSTNSVIPNPSIQPVQNQAPQQNPPVIPTQTVHSNLGSEIYNAPAKEVFKPLMSIMPLADRFFIQRELFENNQSKLQEFASKIDTFSVYEEALSIAKTTTGAPENMAFENLVLILKQKFKLPV